MWTWPARACRSNRLACWSRLWFLGWRIWKECVDALTQKIRQIRVGLLQILTFMILCVEIIWNQMRWTKRHTSHILSSYSSFAQHIKSGSWDQRNWHDWAGHCGWDQDHALEDRTPGLRSAFNSFGSFDQGLGAFALATQARWRVGQWLTDGWRTQVACWTMWSCQGLYRPGSVSEPSSFVVFLLQVNVHMTIRLRDIFGTLRLSDYQLARCDAFTWGCLCLQVWRYVKWTGLPSLYLRLRALMSYHVYHLGQNNIIARNSNGVYEGVAIGGDRWASGARVSPICWSSLMGLMA